jgi:hypothetical protein
MSLFLLIHDRYLSNAFSLNPIVITLGLAEGMPDKPIPFKVLDAVTRPM